MRLTTDAQHVLGQVQGVYLDRALVMPNASAWDFLADRIIGYGGYDSPELGLYQADLAGQGLQMIGQPGDYLVTTHEGLWSDGAGRWVTYHADGTREWQLGSREPVHHWPDRRVVGSSRQGDWVFVQTPGYTVAILRDWRGAERVFDIGQFFFFGGMDQGVCLLQPVHGPLRAFGPDGEIPAPLMPNATPFTTDAHGVRYSAGYQPDYSLVLSRWDETPRGWLLSEDGRDFNPAIQLRSDGLLVIATGQNAGETIARLFEVDPAGNRWRLNGGPWRAPVIVPDVRVPPTTTPPNPIPPNPIPPNPIPPNPIPVSEGVLLCLTP